MSSPAKTEKDQKAAAQLKTSVEQAQPMWKMVLSQFTEHHLAVVGCFIIAVFVTIAVCAPLISKIVGQDPDKQNVFNRYKPMMSRIIVSTDQRETDIEKYIGAHPDEAKAIQNALVEQKKTSVTNPDDAIFDLVTTVESKEAITRLKDLHLKEDIAPLVQTIRDFETLHILGTDELGRDVFIRLVYGTRVSMGVGVLVAITSALFGLLVGALAGFYGGIVDTLLMRITDSLLSLPLLPVLIVVAAIDIHKVPGMSYIITEENQAVMKLVVIMCLFSWMTVARLVRGSVLELKEREFILSARTLGATDRTIILRHMLPNVIAPLLVAVTLGVGESILFEAALSFLGLGIQPPTPSWGNMLFNAQELIYQAPMLAIIPGVLILFTVISFNYLGDGLQDAIDPKAIRR